MTKKVIKEIENNESIKLFVTDIFNIEKNQIESIHIKSFIYGVKFQKYREIFLIYREEKN